MAFSIHIQTESSDHYDYLLEGEPSQEEIIEYLTEQLGEEIEYVSSYSYNSTYGIKFEMDTL